ncbi:MAG: DUF305 domain-containing protein [Chitinophagaceae bacterium]
MKTKIQLAIVLSTGLYFLVSCDNGKTTTDKEKSDTTVITEMKGDSMDNKMDSGGMTKMDNGLMSSMKTMMDKMSSMNMSGDFDLDFANMMIEHHNGAISMSEIEVANGTDEKMKSMAQKIITKQKDEIVQLQEIIKNHKSSGMKHGEGELKKMHREMEAEMNSMQMNGNTDKDFAMMMKAHHEGAVKMFKAELTNGMNDRLKQMAKMGINDQTKEINEFKSWMDGNK